MSWFIQYVVAVFFRLHIYGERAIIQPIYCVSNDWMGLYIVSGGCWL